MVTRQMDKLKSVLRGNDLNAPAEDEERGIIAEALDASTLSWSTRIKGFAICFVIGCLISVISTFFIYKLALFSVLYSLGNILSLGSTLFLMGPMNQLKRMFAPTRLIATIVMLLCLILTLLSAFLWKKSGLTILFCLFQFCAMAWYSLSYIPFARDAITKAFNTCIS